MLDGREITIIGAGIGGLSCALALAQHGARVRVLEQAREITEVGAGLQISPNGVAVLDALGLGTALRQACVQSGAVELRDFRRGARVIRLDMGKDEKRPYLLAHRADLIALLAEAAQGAGIQIELNCQVTGVQLTDTGVRISTANSGTLTPGLVIAADGLHSGLRQVLNGERAPFFTNQVAWRALVPGRFGPENMVQVHMGPGRHVVSYPLRGGALTNVVAVEERKKWMAEGWNHAGDPEDMRRVFAMFCPEIRALLGRVDTVNLWGLFRHPVAGRWFGPGCALLGDAAHPTLPFLAQGANMALEDAWVLADCLAAQEQQEALAAYQQRRRARVERVIGEANSNARNYHLRPGPTRFASHAGLRLAGALMPQKVLQRFDWVYQHDVTQQDFVTPPNSDG